MMYAGIIITGIKASGKSTVGRYICEMHSEFSLVKQTTTRDKRSDDVEGEYNYIDEKTFQLLKQQDAFEIETTYNGKLYGVEKSEISKIISSNRKPILLLTPDSAIASSQKKEFENFITVFIDADEKQLHENLNSRGESTSLDRLNTEKDRSYADKADYHLYNKKIDNTSNLIIALFRYKDIGGVLPKNIIQMLMGCGTLVKSGEFGNIEGASYDIRLGDKYWQNGKANELNEDSPFIKIEPYDFAVVTSMELFDLPKDVVGRFDLTVGYFLKGLILSNGTQVDPGYRGDLLCLLFNASGKAVELKRGKDYATIEFHKLISPAPGYVGPYQDSHNIADFLSTSLEAGIIHKLTSDIEDLKKRDNTPRIALALSAISLVTVIVLFILTHFGILQ